MFYFCQGLVSFCQKLAFCQRLVLFVSEVRFLSGVFFQRSDFCQVFFVSICCCCPKFIFWKFFILKVSFLLAFNKDQFFFHRGLLLDHRSVFLSEVIFLPEVSFFCQGSLFLDLLAQIL